jgi:predicted O-linked N-acetylglucosamine transferase (SPINDLY family)
MARKHWSRGLASLRGGDFMAAARSFERACRAAPEVSLYRLNLANVQRRLHNEAAALVNARQAFALDPRCRISCHLAVDLLRGSGQHAQALALLQALQRDSAGDAEHNLLLGAVLAALGRHQDAAGVFLQVLALQPAHVEAYLQLGFALAALRQFNEAAECFRTVVMIDPANFSAAVYAAHYAAWACDWRQGPDDQQRLLAALALLGSDGQPRPFSPFCLLAMDDDVVLHRRATQIEATRLAAEIRGQAGWPPALALASQASAAAYPVAARALASGRCRVGLVSADFRTHATGLLLVQTLEQLDRARFELVLYAHGADDGTALRQRIVAAADQFVDCSALSLTSQAQRIRDDGVTVLIDMSGYTTGSRLQLFALRPAPVQAVWLAYPGTLGAEWVDYLIGDPVITPLAHAEDFDEKIVQLPLCYEPTDARREHPETLCSRGDLGLPENAFVYACFNQSYKITEPVFSRWCRILQRVQDSVLWLLVPQPDIQATLRQHATERGIAAERLVFAPFVPVTEHLARLPLADVFLDTFPYGAHTTCSDALWMGLPVLTQLGRSMASRVAASLLRAVGLPELAVDNAADYEEIAVRLAQDGEALCDIRDHLWDNRRDLPLFDNRRFAAELGDALAGMARRWQDGLAPAAMPAPPAL